MAPSIGYENLKRFSNSKYNSCFPLKKRRIEYDLESSSEPENLSTKVQDLSIRSHPDLPTLTPPNKIPGTFWNPPECIVPPTPHKNRLLILNQDNSLQNLELCPTKSVTRSLALVSLNSPTCPHHNGSKFNSNLFTSLTHDHIKDVYILPREFYPQSGLGNRNSRASPTENSFCHLSQVNVTTGVYDMPELQRMPTGRFHSEVNARNSVISYSKNYNHFRSERCTLDRDIVSRRSCDSGVSSPSGSSSHSSMSTESRSPTNARYQCTHCAKSYSTVAGLSKHIQFHCTSQVTKTFVCKDCNKVYTSLGALKMHIRTHTLPCKCTLCPKSFSRPWLLQGHRRTHTGEKPFVCQHCHRAFADRSNLRAHLQTHSQVKKYSCNRCAKTFSRMSLLSKHEESGCSAPKSEVR